MTYLKTIIAVVLFATVVSGQTLADRQTVVNGMNQDNPRAGEYHWAAEGPAKTVLLLVINKPITPGECKRTYGVEVEPNPRNPSQFSDLTYGGFTKFGVKCTTAQGKTYVYSVDLTVPGQTPHFTPEPPSEPPQNVSQDTAPTQTSRMKIIESQLHMDQGIALQSKGDQQGAIREYQLAIRLDPTFAKPHNNLANALSSLGDRDGAIRELHAALGLDPFYKIAHYNLALELGRQGDVKEADEHYRAACPAFASRFCPTAGARDGANCKYPDQWDEEDQICYPEWFMKKCMSPNTIGLDPVRFKNEADLCRAAWKRHVEQGR